MFNAAQSKWFRDVGSKIPTRLQKAVENLLKIYDEYILPVDRVSFVRFNTKSTRVREMEQYRSVLLALSPQ